MSDAVTFFSVKYKRLPDPSCRSALVATQPQSFELRFATKALRQKGTQNHSPFIYFCRKQELYESAAGNFFR
jgi:hypothetical protein